MRNKKRVILITGGAQGLGKNLAIHLHKLGHKIIILDIQPFKSISDLYKEIIQDYYEVDISDITAVENVLNIIVQKYKGIDVLINNASLRVFKNFIDFNKTEIKRYININFKTPVLLVKNIFPIMKKNGYGRIINISSKSAYWGYSTGSMYCSTKSALVKFTEAFGRELNVHNDNVTINAICPDSFKTITGKKLKGYNYITALIIKTVDEILVSDKNAEVIPVLLKKTKLLEIMRGFKESILWVTKY